MGITAKIWSGVIVLIIAFITTVTLGCVLGLQTEEALRSAKVDLFPTAIQTYELRNAFKKSLEKYDIGAIYLADSEVVSAADALMTDVQKQAMAISANKGLPNDFRQQIAVIIGAIKEWQTKATPLYIRQADDEPQDDDETVLPQLHTQKQDISKLIDAAVESIRGSTERVLHESEENSVSQRWSSVGIMLGSLAVSALLMTVIINKGIRNPINRIIAALNQSGNSVSNVSNEVLDSSNAVTDMTGSQAGKIGSITAGIEEINAMTLNNAQNAQQVENQADLARQAVEQGRNAMLGLEDTVSKIKSDANAMNSIIKTIEDIAFQTNLLALNAAVEAARAGEAGRGFAVVAEEVRNLATSCAKAANGTNDLIGRTVKNIDSSVTATAQVGGYLADIVKSVDQVSSQAKEVSVATAQESIALKSVGDDLMEVEDLTKTTAHSAQHSSSLGEHLLSEAEQLQVAMHNLDGIIRGIKD